MLETCWHLEGISIPEIGIEERFRDHEEVIRIVRIRHRPHILIAGQYRSRNRSHYPTFRIERGLRNLLARCGHLRSSLHLPSTTRQTNLSFRRRGLSDRLSHQATFTHHSQFTQDIAILVGRLTHEYPYITAFALHANLIHQSVTTRQLSQIIPLLSIHRRLDLTLYGFIDPAQLHLIKVGLATQIHIDPLLTRCSTHPRTVEELRGKQVDRLCLTLLIEVDLIERPIHRTFHLEAHPIVGVCLIRLQRNGLVERTGRQLSRIPAVLVRIGMGFVARLLTRHTIALQTA